MALIKPFLVIASNQTTCFAERNVTIGQSPCQDVDAVINVATDPSLPADIGELRGAGSLATRSLHPPHPGSPPHRIDHPGGSWRRVMPSHPPVTDRIDGGPAVA